MSGQDTASQVDEGTAAMLALRDRRVAAGERQIGWKVGFGSPAARASLGIEAPLVGFLTDRGLVEPGGQASVAGWTRPVLEGEMVVRFGRPLSPRAGHEPLSRDDVVAAIDGVGAAIELADVHAPPTDLREILSGNIYHRHVVLGSLDPSASVGDAEHATMALDGAEVESTSAVTALTGDVLDVVLATSRTLAAQGERLDAGDVVITGSVFPPRPVEPGQRLRFGLAPLGSVQVLIV